MNNKLVKYKFLNLIGILLIFVFLLIVLLVIGCNNKNEVKEFNEYMFFEKVFYV